MRALVGAMVIGALAGSCGAEKPTAVVLAVQSDLSIPTQMDEILVQARDGQGAMLFENRFPLHGSGAVSLPGKLGLQAIEGPSGPIEIEVRGRLKARPAVVSSVRLDLSPGTVREVAVEINQDCLGVLCPTGLTCVAARCESATLPRLPTPAGPPCNCFSLFPICLGAVWAYDEYQSGQKVEAYKQLSFARFAAIGDPAHDKEATVAFLQVRPSVLDFSRKWISTRERPHRVIYWEKEEQFNRDLDARGITYHVPRKIRLNEGLSGPEEERYLEYEYQPGSAHPLIVENVDQWNVIALEEVKRLPSASNFPERFANGRVVCHRRVGVGTIVSLPPMHKESDLKSGTDKVFCYVYGVGKVYEWSSGRKPSEEVLVDYNNPARCSVPR